MVMFSALTMFMMFIPLTHVGMKFQTPLQPVGNDPFNRLRRSAGQNLYCIAAAQLGRLCADSSGYQNTDPVRLKPGGKYSRFMRGSGENLL